MSFKSVVIGFIFFGGFATTAASVVWSQPAPDSGASAKQWRITTTTATTGATPVTTALDLCVSPNDLRDPPQQITGPVCDKQTYTMDGNALKWTGTCDTAKGQGNIVFSDDGNSFSGDISSTVHGAAVTTHIDGRVTGTCKA